MRKLPVLLICLAGAALPAQAAERMRLEIVRAAVTPDQYSGSPAVDIWLSRQSQMEFALFTAEHVGAAIDVLVDGKVLISPFLQTPMTVDRLMLTGLASAEEAEALAARLGGKKSRVEVRVAGE